jgi:hypothetical protein
MAGSSGGKSSSGPLWLIWVALLIAGLLLLAEAFHIYQLTRTTTRLGVALVWSAIALMVGNGRWAGNMGTVIVWLAVVLAYIL